MLAERAEENIRSEIVSVDGLTRLIMNCGVKCDLGVTLSSQSEDFIIVTTDEEPFNSNTAFLL